VSVLFDQARGLQSGDRVFAGERTVGEVEAISLGAENRIAVRLRIRQEFRNMVTDQSRFVVRRDPQRQPANGVELLAGRPGGRPLPDGAQVEGSSGLSALLDRSGQGIREMASKFQEEMDRWEREFRQLPEKEWVRELEKQLELWGRELEKGGAGARERFRRDVLPRMEEMLRQLRERLEDQRREREAQPLERKLEELRGT
jgi:hypothetical protein